MINPAVAIPKEALAEFCRRHHIRWLALFGSVLTDVELGPLVKSLVRTHQATYTEALAEHFEKHLAALKSGM